MLFSVLVPVYNVEKYLKNCLDSILNQTYEDYEIILVDDGSTDKSGNICDEYKRKNPDVINVVHKKNAGLLLARRTAIKMAKGDYIVNCDSDDFLEKNALEKIANIISEYNPDIIQYNLHLYYEDGRSISVNQGKKFVNPNKLYYDMDILKSYLINRQYNIWSMAGKCIKRTCYECNKDYSEYEFIKFGEDTLQSIEVYDNAKNFVYLPSKVYNYRVNTGMTGSLPEKYCDDFFSIKKLLEIYAKKWKVKNYAYKINYYVFDTIYFYLLNISDNNYNMKNIVNKLKAINKKDDFTIACNYFFDKKNNVINIKFKMKLLLKLLHENHYYILAFLLKLRYIKGMK